MDSRVPEEQKPPLQRPPTKRCSQHDPLFHDDVVSASELMKEHTIPDVHTFRVPHVDQWIEDPSKYENKFFRTRTGAAGRSGFSFPVTHNDLVIADIVRNPGSSDAYCFPRAGPRDHLRYHPSEVKAAIVTCGGLCPGINDVIQEIVEMLHYNYSVDTIYGIRCGYRGFYQEEFLPYKLLTPESVDGIHHLGGTILASSRGGFDKDKIIDACVQHGINQIYIIGGDGTHRGAHALYLEAKSRGLKMAIVGIPKTIDNDIALIDKSFGFETAVGEATKAIISADVEARCTPYGIGLVKLMGRCAGFIAAHATLAARNVDLCLVPEVKFSLDGPNGIFAYIESQLKKNGHCVIVVAEGAGQDILKSSTTEKDASGNPRLPPIGTYLKSEIAKYFEGKIPVSIKYNDPSYMIRSVPACPSDSTYCMILAQNAVHGAMAGYTGFSSALVNNRSVMIPLHLIAATSPVSMNPIGRLWERVIRSTHQPE